MGRAPCCEKVGLKRGRWTAEEDDTLASYIAEHGEGSWRSLPKNAGLLRCGKSCRLRWINYLRDGVKRGNISKEEDDLIVKLHATLGNRWSLIASHLPGRTDNEIKNYWNSHLSRQIHTFRRTYAAGRDTTITIDISKLSAAGKRRGGRSPKSKQPGQQEPTTAKVDAKEQATGAAGTHHNHRHQHSTSPASSPRQSDGARSTVVDPDQNQPNGTASISHTPGGPCSEDAMGPMVMDYIDKTGLLDTIGGPDHIGLWESHSPIYEFGLLESESEMDTLICRGVRPETELFTGVEAQVDDLLDMDWEGFGAHLWDEPAQSDLSRGTEPQAATTGSDSDELESFVSWLLSDAC